MNAPNMKQRKPFLLRMDPALHDALESWAQQELRSLNGQIEYLLKEAVAKQRKKLQVEKTAAEQSLPQIPER
jgi:hypothetical protein